LAHFRGENIGFIFQSFNLIPVLSVYENIEYPLIMIQNLPQAERHERIMQLLEDVDMLDQKDKFPDQLSGGQRQRVAIARALVTNMMKRSLRQWTALLPWSMVSLPMTGG
jgi:putative ABC transport system ATP-binding protein